MNSVSGTLIKEFGEYKFNLVKILKDIVEDHQDSFDNKGGHNNFEEWGGTLQDALFVFRNLKEIYSFYEDFHSFYVAQYETFLRIEDSCGEDFLNDFNLDSLEELFDNRYGLYLGIDFPKTQVDYFVGNLYNIGKNMVGYMEDRQRFDYHWRSDGE